MELTLAVDKRLPASPCSELATRTLDLIGGGNNIHSRWFVTNITTAAFGTMSCTNPKTKCQSWRESLLN